MGIYVGCGSWTDAEYNGVLYPPGVPAKDRLATYATRLDHVEVNSTYYASPRASVVAGWVKQTPPGFRFHIKLHRAFSRNPRKAATEGDLVSFLLKGVQPLIKADRLGAFLLVLAPDFTPDRHTLAELDPLVEKLRPHALAVELRHADWVKGKARADTLAAFRERGLVWVAVDMPRIAGSRLMPPIDEVTHPTRAYLRLHGRNPRYLEAGSAAEGHHYDYPAKELNEIAKRVRRLAEHAADVHVVANNHAEDFAPKTALALKDRLSGEEAEGRKRVKGEE